MTSGNAVRVAMVLGCAVALIGSAQSNQNQNQQQMTAQYAQSGGSPPPPQEMEPARALGIWRSTFGAVKIEADARGGGIEAGALQGAWVYQRQGQEVVGLFWGTLRGNVLEFKWQEPPTQSGPPLTGSGYLVFDRSGRQYSGRWWSERRDRVGDWNGWRNQAGTGDAYNQPRNPNPYGQPDEQQDPNADPYANPQRGPQPAPGGYGPQPAPGGYGPQPQPGPYPRQPQPQPRQPQPQPYGPQPQPTYY